MIEKFAHDSSDQVDEIAFVEIYCEYLLLISFVGHSVSQFS